MYKTKCRRKILSFMMAGVYFLCLIPLLPFSAKAESSKGIFTFETGSEIPFSSGMVLDSNDIENTALGDKIYQTGTTAESIPFPATKGAVKIEYDAFCRASSTKTYMLTIGVSGTDEVKHRVSQIIANGSGTFLTVSAPWTVKALPSNNWYHFTHIINRDNPYASMRTYYRLSSDTASEDQPIVYGNCAANDSQSALYEFNGNYFGNPQANYTLGNDISSLYFIGTANQDYIDNVSIKTYDPLSASVSNAQSATELKKAIDLLADLQFFTKSATEPENIYEQLFLLGTNYQSTAEVQNAYDQIIAKGSKSNMLWKKNYSFENGITGFSNANIVSDPSWETYNYPDRKDNSVLDPIDASTSVLNLDAPVSGILIYQFDMFADYYGGTTDSEYKAGDSRGSSQYTSYKVSVGNGTNSTRIFRIVRSGNFDNENGGWSVQSANKHKWYTFRLAVNTENNTMSAFYKPVNSAEAFTPIEFNVSLSDGYTKSTVYPFDGVKYGNNKNGSLPATITNIMIGEANSNIDNWTDNVSASEYQYFYEAVNRCETTEEIKTTLEQYADFGVFDFGTKYNDITDKTLIYQNILDGISYTSSVQIQERFDAFLENLTRISDGSLALAEDDFETELQAGQWSGAAIVTSPTVSYDHSLLLPSSTTVNKSLQSITDATYVTADFRIYKTVSALDGVSSLMIGENEAKLLSLTNGRIDTDYDCDPALTRDANNQWIIIKALINTKDGTYKIYKKDGADYFLIDRGSNTEFCDISALTKLTVSSGFCDAFYLDDVKLNAFSSIKDTINGALNLSSIQYIVQEFAQYGIFQLPAEFKALTDSEYSTLYENLLQKNFADDAAVSAVVDAAVIQKLQSEHNEELLLYTEQKGYSGKTLSNVSVVINKQTVNSQPAKIIMASYQDRKIKDVKITNYNGSLTAGTKIVLDSELAIDGADQYKILVLNAAELVPLCKNLERNYGMKNIDTNYYPNWTRKAVTFSYDDGNVSTDKKAISYLNAAGMKATFNIISNTMLTSYIGKGYTPDSYREVYAGHEIASHTKWHTRLIPVGTDPETTAEYTFATEYNIDGLYWYPESNGLRLRATYDTYCRSVTEGKEDLEKIFGEGNIRGFVWPFSVQNNADLIAFIKDRHDFMRNSAVITNTNGFSLPADWSNWNCNTSYNNLLSTGNEYAVLSDDGTLKFFCAGIHTADLNTACTDGVHSNFWYQLEEFCKLVGNQPNIYWYATNTQILDYTNALKALSITDTGITNHSACDVYIMIDGEKVIIPAHSVYGK